MQQTTHSHVTAARPPAAVHAGRYTRTRAVGLCSGKGESHGNTEIEETVIFDKCNDFAKMPCFRPTFLHEYSVAKF